MRYGLSLSKKNIRAHLDIERDIQKTNTGMFTFTIRINDGDIVDYAPVEYIDAKKKYFGLESIIVKEHTVSYHSTKRGRRNKVRGDNL